MFLLSLGRLYRCIYDYVFSLAVDLFNVELGMLEAISYYMNRVLRLFTHSIECLGKYRSNWPISTMVFFVPLNCGNLVSPLKSTEIRH